MSRYYVATIRLFPKSFTMTGYEIIEAEDVVQDYNPEMESKWPVMEIKFSMPAFTPYVIATTLVRKRLNESFQYMNQRVKDAVLLDFVKNKAAEWNDMRHNAEMGRPY